MNPIWIATFETLPFVLLPITTIYGVLKKRKKSISLVLLVITMFTTLIAVYLYIRF